MATKIPHVPQRGNTYHFRIAIPKDLRGHSELPSGSHIQKSLGTSDVGVEKREATKIADEWKIRFDALSVSDTVMRLWRRYVRVRATFLGLSNDMTTEKVT